MRYETLSLPGMQSVAHSSGLKARSGFPLLQEFEIPATFFVVSSFIDGLDWIWTDKILWLSRQPGISAELAPENLARCFHALNRKRPEERNQWITATAARAGQTIPERPP